MREPTEGVVVKLRDLRDKGHTAAKKTLAMVEPKQNRVGLILGTGWGDPSVIKRYVTIEKELDFWECGVQLGGNIDGHAGKFLFGTWGKIPVVVSSGRVHFNQTHDDRTLLRDWMGILLAFMGQGPRLIVTQAVGGLTPELPVGTLAIPTTTFVSHLQPTYMQDGEFFTPEAELPKEESPYMQAAVKAAATAGLPCRPGVFYHPVCGPIFGGRGDRRVLKALGFETIGMSLIPELALTALNNGGFHEPEEELIRVAPIQFVTDNQEVPTHAGNTHEAKTAAPKLGAFLNEIIHAEW